MRFGVQRLKTRRIQEQVEAARERALRRYVPTYALRQL